MRPSNRTSILDAAVAVIESDGITAVTFDSVAAAADLTRGGIIYHFRSRDELIAALHEHLASTWERQLVETCGKPASDATPRERLIAYVRVTANAASRAELQMLINSHGTDHFAPWGAVLSRWTPQRDTLGTTPEADAEWMALLAADGLWISDAVNEQALTPDQRARVAEVIVRRLETSRGIEVA
ncbi:TetR/AcrR family transcriptional regulator [Microbacterium sp. 1P06AB]|uniref:TetR/AcrR family transcriptional regulator n=1 Tax=Microbacterium sp. 1P06AB TaxID=3132289 RepID=UPI0039A49E4E